MIIWYYSNTVILNYRIAYIRLRYFYGMAKPGKSIKSKETKSYRIDPDLYMKAKKKCLELSIASDNAKTITVSSIIEELLREWVNKKQL